MRLIIQPDYKNVSKWAANYIVKSINQFKPTQKKPFVLNQQIWPKVEVQKDLESYEVRTL